jgi:hypothetical protein
MNETSTRIVSRSDRGMGRTTSRARPLGERTAVCLLLLVPMCLGLASCAATGRVDTAIEASRSSALPTDSAIAIAGELMSIGQYDRAREVLRSLGLHGSSYYRVDEILFQLGRCHLNLNNPRKALRAFSLLRRYYADCEERFPDLARMRQDAEALHVQDSIQDSEGNTAPEPPSAHIPHTDSLATVSNVYFETDIRQVLTDLSAQTGVSIVFDAMVQGYVSLELKGVHLEQALDQVLTPLGCSFRRIGDYYLVGKNTPDSPAYPLLAETKAVTLNYLDADAVSSLVPDYFKDLLRVDKNSKTMTVSAPPATIERFSSAIAAIDTKRQQFVIEIAVVEISSSARQVLGVSWDWTGTKGNDSFRIAKLRSSVTDSSMRAGLSWIGSERWGFTHDLRLAVEALATDGKARFKANPQVTTQQGREATIRIGREAYYSLVSGSVTYPYFTLEKIATGVSLKLTPFMGGTPDVTNDIDIEVSDVTGAGANNLPVTSVRAVKTRVQVENGQTFGIGGLVTRTDHKESDRIPVLGSIPLIGFLFGRSGRDWNETEVIILVTPHALIDAEEFRDL